MKIEAGGIEINYEVSGEGPYLVLIHGFGDNLTMWYNQVGEFSKRFNVITYDVRGFGETSGFGEEFSMAVFADDLYHLLKSLRPEDLFHIFLFWCNYKKMHYYF